MLLKNLIAISFMMMSSVANAYNILIVAPLPFQSHYIFLEGIITRLIDRGFYLTVISPFKNMYPNPSLKEYVIPKFKVEDIFPSKDVFNGNFESDIRYIQAQYKIGLAVSEHTLSQPEIKKFIAKKDYEYDAVIADSSYLDSLYMFSYKFGCPLITFDVNGHNTFLDESMGSMIPHSFIPHPVTKYENNMSYMQRCYNTLLYLFEAAVRKFSYIPAQNKLAKKYFSNGISGEIPHINNVIKNISLVLSNSYRVTQKRPKMPSQIDVAGAHIQEPFTLPSELQEILSNSQRSVIYFSFGSYLKPSEMPKEKFDEIIKAFSNIKKTILWQYDGDIPAGLPNNVIMKKWFPQNDLLGNKKVVLFITHGGILSFQEALSNRAPMLIIPFTGDQYRNGLQAERGHYGKMLLFDDLTEQTLTDKIREITDDNTYFSHIQRATTKLLDSPIEAVKEATFWIQYVCKQKGIEKSPSVNFSWFTYYNLDVIGFYVGILLTCILFWVVTIKLITKRYRNREQKGKFKYY